MEGGKCGQKIRNNSLMLFHDDVYNLLEREEDGVRDREQKKKGKKQSKAKQTGLSFLFPALCLLCSSLAILWALSSHRTKDESWPCFSSYIVTLSLPLCQQTTTASICDRCTGARAAFRFCIINCRTPVVIDTCARHGSKRRGREEGEGK